MGRSEEQVEEVVSWVQWNSSRGSNSHSHFRKRTEGPELKVDHPGSSKEGMEERKMMPAWTGA